MLKEYKVYRSGVVEHFIDDEKRAREALSSGHKVMVRPSDPFLQKQWKEFKAVKRERKGTRIPSVVSYEQFKEIQIKQGTCNMRKLAIQMGISPAVVRKAIKEHDRYKQYRMRYQGETESIAWGLAPFPAVQDEISGRNQ